MKNYSRPKVCFRGELYRNKELADWIEATFGGASEREAAWETVKFIRESWPEAGLILRGKLIGVDEGEA